MSLRNLCLAVLLGGTMVTMVGCTAPGENAQEKRDNIQKMQDESMAELTAKYPEVKQEISKAAGYAVLKTWTMGLIPGGGAGYGVMVDNATGKKTYLQMGQFTLGFLIMAKDGRTLMVFNSPQAVKEFTTENWLSGGAADATFNFGEFGGNANATGYFDDRVKVYEITENGLALRAYLPLIKYSPYNQLNGTTPEAKPAAK